MKTGSFARRIYAVLLSLVLLAGELFAAPAVTYGAEPLTADETEDIMINDIDTGDREGEATGNEDDAITPGEGEVPGIQDVTISDEDGDKGVTEDVNDPDEELSGSIEAKGDGEVVEYDLWVGSTQVTSANCTDLSGAVTGVGATASYDPTTKTLTLDKVTGVNGFAESETYKALIFCKEGSLKLRGNASLIAMDYASKGVVGLYCNLDIAGTFAIVTDSYGVYTNAGYGLTVSGEDTRIEVTSGTFDAINTSEYKQSEGKVLVAGKENGLYAGKAVIDGGVLSATGEEYAIKVSGDTEDDIVINDKLSITNPENGTVSTIKESGHDYVTIVDKDEKPATYVSIEEESPYKLYVGSVPVTEENKDNIPGVTGEKGAKASYDPTTNTLTLDKVTGVKGTYIDPYWWGKSLIYSVLPLKIRGNAKLTNEEGSVIWARKGLDIEGQFELTGKGETVYCAGLLSVGGKDTNIKITSDNTAILCGMSGSSYVQNGGTVELSADNYGIQTDGNVTVNSGTLIVNTDDTAILASGEFELGSGVEITTPEGGSIVSTTYIGSTRKTIIDQDSTVAKNVVIEPKAEKYDLWIGKTQVTSKNCGDLSDCVTGEGATASYDPATNTLTLDKVTGIIDVNTKPVLGDKCLIYDNTDTPLKLRGTANIKFTEGYTIYARGLELEGLFNFEGNNTCIYTGGKPLTINGSTTEVTVKANYKAISCGGTGYVQNEGKVTIDGYLYMDRDFVVNGGLFDATYDGTAILIYSGDEEDVVIGNNMEIVVPEDGKPGTFTTASDEDYATIMDKDNNPAKTVRIEPKTERYDLWVGEYRVTGLNKDNIPGIKGTNAKATYDPETKTLTFSGEVTGVTGTHGSGKFLYMIYAGDDLTIAGDATLTGRDGSGDDNDKGISISGDLTIVDDLALKNVGIGIYASSGDINVKGSLTVDVPAKYTNYWGISCNRNMTIDGGNVNVEMLGSNKTAIQGYTTTCLKMTSGSLTATTASNNSAINVASVDMSGGSLTAATKSNYQPALKVSKGLSVTGGVIEASNAGLTSTAVEAQTITLGPKVMIVEPYSGIVKNVTDSGQNYDRIFNADGSKAAPYAIITDTDPAKYACVSFMSNGEEVGRRYAAKGKGISSFIPDSAPATPGDQLIGWFHDEKFMDRADLNDVYTVDSTLYAKWVASGTELYTVTFYTSGRVDNIPDQIVEAGGKVTQPVIPTVVGNEVFLYWYNSADAAQPYDFDAPVTSDLELVSMWKTIDPDGFTIAFVDGEYDDDHYWYNETTKHWELTYNGKPRTLSDEMLKVYSAEGEMVRGVDYTVSFKNNTKASTAKKTATVIVKGKGPFKGKKIIKYYIVPRAAVDEDGKLDETHGFRMDPIIVQSGKKISPVIYYKSMKLTSKDYKLSYTGKAKATTDKVTITFTGNFRGVLKDQPVTVLTKKEIDANAIKVSFKAGTHTYTPSDDDENQYCVPQTVSITKEEGDPKVINKGELTVKNAKGEILVEGTHFNVRYFDNKNAGTAKVVISAIAPYTGMVTKTFKISPNKSIPLILSAKPDADADIRYVPGGVKPADRIGVDINNTVNPYKELTHTTLEQGRDYKITWKNNKAVTTNRKQASYKVTFIGNYKGHSSFNGTFSIKKADFVTNANQMISVNAPDQVYTGKKKYQSAPLVILTDHSDGPSSLLSSKDYNVRYFTTEDGVEKDITGQKITLGADEDVKLIRMELTGKGNFTSDTVSKYYYVRKKAADAVDLSKAKIAAKGNKKRKAVGTKAYTGNPITPEIDVYVKSGKKWVLVNPSAYTVTYVNNTNKGKATILVTGRGATAVGSKSAKFSIAKRSIASFLFNQ